MKHFKIVLLSALFLTGCATTPRYTQPEWLERMPPPDTVEKGKAMGILQAKIKEAEAKAAAMKTMDKVKVICAVGFIGSIFAIALKQTLFGSAGALASLAGFALAYAGTEFGKYLGMAGLIIGLAGGGYAAFVVITALKEIVKGGEDFKNETLLVTGFTDAQKAAQKTSSTPKLVKKIKENLGKKQEVEE